MNRLQACAALSALTILLVIALAAEPQAVQSAGSSVIRGVVVDAATDQPIAAGTVRFWGTMTTQVGRGTQTTEIRDAVETKANGSFRFSFEGRCLCTVFAYVDDPATPGCDYLPKLYQFSLESGKEANVVFRMTPAASIVFAGDLLFVDSASPPDKWEYKVLPRAELPEANGSLLRYGPTITKQYGSIDMNSSHVIVPADTPIILSVEPSTKASHNFIINDPSFSNLTKGEAIRVKTVEYSLPHNLNFTKTSMAQPQIHAAEAQETGLYVFEERLDLQKALSLIGDAEEESAAGLYEEAYADLREAYTKAAYVEEKIRQMLAGASSTVPLLIAFLAFASTAISYLFFEDWVKKILGAGATYLILVIALFHLYAGSRVFDVRLFLAIALASISLTILVAFILPRRFSMTVFFSLAKRNIRRRMTRFILTLLPITVLVFSFVALTSFSTQYGFAASTIGNTISGIEGLLVREHPPTIPSLTETTRLVVTFKPLDDSMKDYLVGKPEVTLAAPKAENYPSRSAIGSLSFQGRRINIFGILGVVPSLEAEATNLDRIADGRGRYLRDDEDAVMISDRAAQTLEASVGDTLVLNVGATSLNVTLAGIVSDDELSSVKDLDGSPMLPQKLIIRVVDQVLIEARIDTCEPNEVVVTNWQVSSALYPKVLTSRIDVHAESPDLLSFARQIALERDLLVSAATGNTVTLMGIVPYLESKGTAIVIPWLLAILNVTIVMVNAVYERRREVTILSSVGLNPTHVTSLFLSEALIIGIIGGGIGYILGLSSYRVMALFQTGIEVRQKISFEWCLASLGISVTAVLVGAFVALRSSIIMTPSLLRRWTSEHREQSSDQEYEYKLPIRVREDALPDLLGYMRKETEKHVEMAYGVSSRLVEKLTSESLEETPESHVRTIEFRYRFGSIDPIGMFPFQLRAERRTDEETYGLRIMTRTGDSRINDKLVTFIRMLMVNWTARRR